MELRLQTRFVSECPVQVVWAEPPPMLWSWPWDNGRQWLKAKDSKKWGHIIYPSPGAVSLTRRSGDKWGRGAEGPIKHPGWMGLSSWLMCSFPSLEWLTICVKLKCSDTAPGMAQNFYFPACFSCPRNLTII